MRDAKDIYIVDVATVRRVNVDLEILEQTPRFRTILESFLSQHDVPEATLLAVQDYVTGYISAEQFPYSTPGTTGPGSIIAVQVEVKGDASNRSGKSTSSESNGAN